MKEKTFQIKNGDISDGYHTFDELYEHRCLLFLNLCLANSEHAAWKEFNRDWFILYWESPQGQISYHLPMRMRALIVGKIKEDREHSFDGHTPDDVLSRLVENAVQIQAGSPKDE